MGNVITTIQEWLQVNVPVWHDELARTNRWNFIGVLLVIMVGAVAAWAIVRGGRWLWGSHVRQIERRVNRGKETQKPTLDVESLRNLNKEEREKKINEILCITS